MNVENQIKLLKEKAHAIEQEIGMAVMFHETWKPTAYDENLRKRMGMSYATQAFLIVQVALRREMLLALTRLWDKQPNAVRMPYIAQMLRDDLFFEAFVAFRAERLGAYDAFTGTAKETLVALRYQLLHLIDKYSEGGSERQVVERLLVLRNECLAHRQTTPTRTEVVAKTGGVDATDQEIELFYQANLEIVRLLLTLVLAKSFDLQEAADVYREYAKYFWVASRGECSEGS